MNNKIPRIIPTLLLREGALVKTQKFRKSIYIGDAINAVKIFNDKEADELVVLDIDATHQSHSPDLELIRELASEAFMPVAYGGGIKSIDQVKSILRVGIEKVVIGAQAWKDPEFISEVVSKVGSSSVVVSVDYKNDWLGRCSVHIESGQKNVKIHPVEYVKRLAHLGVGEILLSSIDRDGTMEGFDFQMIEAISKSVDIPVIPIGGASNIKDAKHVIQSGASAMAAGSIFVFHGKQRGVLITYPNRKEIENVFE